MATRIEPRSVRDRLHARSAALVALAFAALFGVLASGAAPCTFAQVFHVPCPGCGSTRAVHALLHGDLAGAVHANPLGPVIAALLLAVGVVTTVTVLRDGSLANVYDSRKGRALVRALLAVAVLEVVLWVSRFFGVLGGPVPV